ncbi:MAG TPA: serine--tRNA ligase, partial [Desulfotomaculum sp.]|nr:serine--tRNA ligase [Desulfotomaculum sp.]
MLDIKFIRNNPEAVKNTLAARGVEIDLDEFLRFDKQWREKLAEVEQLRSTRNIVSEKISRQKKDSPETKEIILEMRMIAGQIKELEEEIRQLEEKIQAILLVIPNMPHETVPIGESAEDNVVLRYWGKPRNFDFNPKSHWDLGEALDILDFERGSKVAGARFVFYKGIGAQLERALINFMLNLHVKEHGYVEIFPPFIVNNESMLGTGQLPKFAQEAFKIENTNYYLIPTAEVPVTNIYRDEILNGENLPICYAAYSACFRAEAGAAGRDTRGLIRQHQFNKVELVKFCRPEESNIELEKLTRDAEKILQLLALPYRIVSLCTGDLGFSAAKTYDLEVWLPSYNEYKEISSCSNFTDFQARRANIRFRSDKRKPQFIHTLNGSGLAIGRTVAAILENYQESDGSVCLPEVLVPYLNGVRKINFAS